MRGRIVIGIIVLAVVIGAFMIGQGGSTVTARTDSRTTAEQPGYSARNARVIETGQDGRPAYTVDAAVVRQRPNDSRVQLAAPRMSILTEDGETVYVQARAAQIQADGSNVELYGDVKLSGEFSGAPMEATTSIMSFDTKEEVARAPGRVRVKRHGVALEAVGLKVDLKRGDITLESKINGIFATK